MFLSDKIKTGIYQIFGINPYCPYKEKYENTEKLLIQLNEKFNKDINTIRIEEKLSISSFKSSIDQLNHEVCILISDVQGRE